MIDRKLVTAGIALTLAATLGAGVTSAATHSSAIHACAKKSSGALRIAKKCASDERHITLNARGQRGPRGARGRAGSTTVTTIDDLALGAVTNTATSTALPLGALPNGSYFFVMNISFDNESSATFYANCAIDGTSLGSRSISNAQSAVVPPAAGSEAEFKPGALTLTGVFTKSKATVLKSTCVSGDGSSDLTATLDAEILPVGAIVPTALSL